MKVRRSLLLMCTLLAALPACRDAKEPSEQANNDAPGEVAASDKQRIVAAAPPAELSALVTGGNDFAFSLYRELTTAGENLFFSPASISTALSRTYAGAAGDTAAAFEAVLGSKLPAAAHHRAMNDLDRQLNARGQGARGADGQPFRLNTTNQLFAQQGFPFEMPFLDTLALEYGADVRLLDFVGATEPARQEINGWVANRTEDRIPELLSPGVLTTDTRLVLVNAIYFNAAWRTPFGENATTERDFHKLDGTTKRVPFMLQGDLPTRAAQVNGIEVFELPYDGDELAMLVLMPEQGGLATLEASLSAAQLDAFVAALKPEHLDLAFPSFENRTQANLNDALEALGLGIAYSSNADFSAMSPRSLAITDVVHEAFVKVNEKGTEAAAATAVIVGETSVPITRTLVADRPFVFLIRDNATGAVVFAGRIVEP